MSASPPRVQRPAPLLAQHNQEVFCDLLGYSAEEYRRLRESGAVWKVEGR
jgi:crotonobetainyl-CoA:carnitine CoA-transferase CaiB-like acyl-CoA transferase